jgi:ABC-type uncharacterized transport system substrate-binding protein
MAKMVRLDRSKLVAALLTSHLGTKKADFDAALDRRFSKDDPHHATRAKFWNEEPCTRSKAMMVAEALGVSLDDLVKDADDSGSSINIAVLLSGVMAFTLDIWQGFRAEIDRTLAESGVRAEFFTSFGLTDPLNDSTKARWSSITARLLEESGPRGFDYHVAIGTQAALAMRKFLDDDLGRRVPFLFLGVTDPVTTGLIDSTIGRNNPRDVAGINYIDGFGPIVDAAREFFPGRKLVFLYQKDVPQDRSAARIIQEMKENEHRSRVDQILATDAWPSLDDMPDPEAVYLSWNTFDTMFEDLTQADCFRERIIFGTTRGNVRKFKAAVAGASVQDEKIGIDGARLLLARWNQGNPWSGQNVCATGFQCWINCDTALERKIAIHEKAFSKAEAFGDRQAYLRWLHSLQHASDSFNETG